MLDMANDQQFELNLISIAGKHLHSMSFIANETMKPFVRYRKVSI